MNLATPTYQLAANNEKANELVLSHIGVGYCPDAQENLQLTKTPREGFFGPQQGDPAKDKNCALVDVLRSS